MWDKEERRREMEKYEDMLNKAEETAKKVMEWCEHEGISVQEMQMLPNVLKLMLEDKIMTQLSETKFKLFE